MRQSLKIGDIVSRKSYNNDVYFLIDEIITEGGRPKARLRGLDIRLLADSPLDDLSKVTSDLIRDYRKKFIKKNNECLRKIFARRAKEQKLQMTRSADKETPDFFDVPGRVLHLDGNQEYLNLCMAMYQQLGIKAGGLHIPEMEQPASVPVLLKKHKPDILVLTGHDGIIRTKGSYSDLENYHNSKYFVEGVKEARKIECNKDNLVVFAGACQSNYGAILAAGANYASSPNRVFIHAFDPVFIVEKIAFTPISQIISVHDVIDSTITGTEGLGGLETRGKFRKGFPKSQY